MNPRLNRSITLMELLIAIVLMTLMVLSFASIDLYSRYHVFTADRRAQVQNEVSYVLEHMSKEISRAIGDITNPTDPSSSAYTIPVTLQELNRRIRIFIDNNQDGRISPVGPNPDQDRRIAYRYRPSTVLPPPWRYQVWYCRRCSNILCFGCAGGWPGDILSRKITSFFPTYNPSDNYLDIELTGRWDPTQPSSLDNPEVTMRTRIKMPSVSTN